MSGPRNLAAVQRSLGIRHRIRELLAERSHLLPPLSAKAIKSALHLAISERAVRWHLNAIRLEAELAELGCHHGNSLNAPNIAS